MFMFTQISLPKGALGEHTHESPHMTTVALDCIREFFLRVLDKELAADHFKNLNSPILDQDTHTEKIFDVNPNSSFL